MSDLFNLTSARTEISVNFRKFQSSGIIFQIIYTYELNNIKTIFVLRDLKKFKESTVNPEFLIIGYFGEELLPVNKEESIKTLELLLSYSKSELLNIGLSTDKIIQSINFLRKIEITKKLAYYELTSNIFALIRQEGEISNLWDLEICSKHEVKLQFESFYFIGGEGSNDHIMFTVLSDNLNHKEINKIHLLEDFYININTGEGFRKEYTAICTKVEKNEEIIEFYFSSFIITLQKTIMGFLEAAKVKPHNLMYLMLRSAGLKEENISIEGLKKDSDYNYSVTILIKNLTINEPFGIGLVSFYPMDNVHEIFNSFSDQLKKEIDSLNGKYCWARINIKSNNIFDAYKLGRKSILQSVDVLSSVVRDDHIFNFCLTNNEVTNWNRDYAIPKLIVTTISNIYNNISNENVTMDFQNIFEPSFLVMNCDILEIIKKIKWVELFLIDDEKKNETVQLLMSSLKWLNRSWYSENINDKLINISLAMEFMIAGEPSEIIYDKKILKEIKEKLKDITCIDIDRILNLINQPSFNMRLNNMITKLNIPISQSDLSLLNKIREERNKLFHGSRECEVDDLDIAISNNIVLMMVIKKLYSLKD